MSHASAAAVIDLQDFRARRACRMRSVPTEQPTAAPLAPFWVVWIPVWPVR